MAKKIGLNWKQTRLVVNLLFEMLMDPQGDLKEKTAEGDWGFLEGKIKETPFIKPEQLKQLLK